MVGGQELQHHRARPRPLWGLGSRQRQGPAVALALLLGCASAAGAGAGRSDEGRLVSVQTFADGNTTAIMAHQGNVFLATSLTIPHNVTVATASLKVSGHRGGANETDWPHNVSVDVADDSIPDYTFAGTGYGGLGLQHLFTDGGEDAKVEVLAGIDNGTSLYLPKGATLTSAQLDLTGIFELGRDFEFQEGMEEYQSTGAAMVNAGDLDGDGWDDLAVGSPFEDTVNGADSGAVRIYSGGAPVDLDAPDLELLGPHSGALFGWSIAGGR